MAADSPYFYIEQRIPILTISQLLNLTQKQSYGQQDNKLQPELQYSLITPYEYNMSHSTCGIFRGQAEDWPLLPTAYRDLKPELSSESSDFKDRYNYHHSNYQLQKFCENAAQQNQSFPSSKIEQMVIAQHYGIKTPLIDWSANIFVAIYFALDLKDEGDKEKNLEPFIYHIKSERLLENKLEDEQNIELARNSVFVRPVPLDRRIERQFSRFTFHPLPYYNVRKIPVTEYKLSGNTFIELWKIMESLGFSSSHYFPDYAGLSERLKHGFML